MPGWDKMTCTSRGIWLGAASGSTSSAGVAYATRKKPNIAMVAAPFVGPWLGTLASTRYIDACEHDHAGGNGG